MTSIPRAQDQLFDGRKSAREKYVSLVVGRPGWRALITHEFFCGTGREQARGLVESLAPAEVHVVITARDTLGMLTAGWAEYVKNGGTEPLSAMRGDSIGKAIPDAEILVLPPDGSPCGPGEEGELVHRGPLVALGYWNDPERTAMRFRALPGREAWITLPPPA